MCIPSWSLLFIFRDEHGGFAEKIEYQYGALIASDTLEDC